MKCKTYIGLGSNLENPREQVLRAVAALKALPDCDSFQCSTLIETAPVGYLDQPNFINAVVAFETSLSPMEILQALQGIERAQGRQRLFKNGPRTLDLDLLWMEGCSINTEALTLPHPRMHERDFVMIPLLELNPSFVI
jgi:2-amino-4-hydroxy-6-hydroxymethyldihydropteridine diphosphokinase